ncbi:septation ring formation regulator EzrA [Alkalihalobacillus oceani]|uniref:Septation ring formation regulator EzrA n=1 Tax=Halalkalibacter oceani TaxID=1653776 RepID=A0A9X2IQ21_9BACI|nr:septation ring formation regulator EzrA [Halalkalibacter oceani]MCM3715012.1 septation ring formation regulator EzrA [Halalkalibacter oceani]
MRYVVYTAIAIILVLIVISAILRRKTYKEVDQLEEWKNDILNRTIPEEIGKVKQLHMSGQTEEKFEEWRSEWDDIVGTILPNIEEQLFDIEELAAKNRFKKAKLQTETTRQRLQGIEDQLKQMLEEIDQLVQSEEQNRTEIDDVRRRYKELQAALLKRRGSLGKGVAGFDERMEQIQTLLESFETATAEGSYLKARDHLLKAGELLQETESLLERYPKLLVQAETTIPNELKEIEEGMKGMEEAGYKLEPFSLEKQLSGIKSELDKLKEELLALKCDEAEERLHEVSAQIEGIYELLEFEVDSKQFVTEQLPELEQLCEQAKNQINDLFEETVQVQQSYHISKEKLAARKKMEEAVLDLTRQLDVLQEITANESQTFTSIREMVEEWKLEITKLTQSIAEDKQALFALREDEWRAKETLHSLQETLLDTKRTIKKSNIPGLPEAALLTLQEAEQKMDEASEQLHQVPLELGRVTVLVEEAVKTVKESEELINDTIELATFAEYVIQFGNRFRSRSHDVHQGLTNAEHYFRQYEYEQAVETAVAVIKPYDPDVLERVEEYLNMYQKSGLKQEI